ncbi:helicase-exonuclease AddAB subunit AddA [Candidatus Galacturonibacter soehngenii]|uniref:ATP-dependent helicase/nuclease subunit A n=1 Tax=Candidatus Galacturonatibacter soehngenii TaxID=2307010 RepID=A0A7V7QNA4_9FIRM|nr:helicase-exonuclease AddAB subunit AddA [Candidatus Galacturonibacter soehngenii]KAB1440451.1 helicase-exonuclease AddAB subunit AddA [Candidatus Galacturonibacter soehngenii]
MEVAWTSEQRKVIDLRERNILVSAAAGSGKTAVLVERIITMITDEETPIDIDQLLIVTFTNAAASQMRERISEAIEEKLSKEPENVHLQKQAILVHNAYITTIHSFCLRVIRNHFNRIDLDPSFRIGDEGELKLLRADVLERILEKHYEGKEEEFFRFVESYSTGKTDKDLEQMILQLYQFAMSYPWPKDWLKQCVTGYDVKDIDELQKAPWYINMVNTIIFTLQEMVEQMEQLLDICMRVDGPYMYEATLREEKAMLERMIAVQDYVALSECFEHLSFGRLSSKKDENVSVELREIVKKQRDGIKKTVSAISERYFYAPYLQILEDMQKCRESVEVLTTLTAEFIEEYQKVKQEKNLVDYNDLEHYALQILVEKEGNDWKPSEAAKEFQDIFVEIMIDEYQDSNLVQEMLLQSVSRVSQQKYNIFMVGDVKQSIYKFRLARPELFMEKYNSYSLEDSLLQRIDLDRNFRSRGEVLSGTNFIFNQIMMSSIGGIEYNKECALYLGGSYEEPIKERDYEAEVMVIDLDSSNTLDEENKKSSLLENKDYSARELEAKAIAMRIKELINEENGLKVIDKKTKEYRSVQYRDIVILLRTMAGWAETFTSILMAEGIATHTGSQTGYFSTIEVMTLLNLLRIIDNPLQDIAFAAVLSSPIVSVTGEELALIKGSYQKQSLFEGCRQYAIEGSMPKLRDKLKSFFEQIKRFRKLAVYTPIHELIWIILDETNYARFVAAMPAGEQRKANLDMLIEKAIVFESTSYKGLFNFVRYIENLQKYDVDFGEAEIANETDDTVRILSIHKSKGLEFPVVFVSGMGKTFNNQDARAKLIMHPDLGIGADYVDYELRIKAPTLIKKAIQKQIQMENLAEELRVLYVALTRAKEKLILTGAISKLESKIINWSQNLNTKEKLGYRAISEAGSYLEWVLPALIRHPDSKEFLEVFEIGVDYADLPFSREAKYFLRFIGFDDLVKEEVVKQVLEEDAKEELKQGFCSKQDDEELLKSFEERLNFSYPYQELQNIHTKMTVSEIKKMGQNQEEENQGVALIQEEVPVPLLPRFLAGEEELRGSELGVAYHKVLQLLDLKHISKKEDIELQLEKMVEEQKLSKEAKESIRLVLIEKFLQSGIGKRMIHAHKEGRLYRERPFVIGVKAKQIKESFDSEEMVLVQGIMDAFFEEEGEIILVDYKTDYVKSEKELRNRYRMQMDYYTQALEMITGKKVKERILYAITLGKEIVF